MSFLKENEIAHDLLLSHQYQGLPFYIPSPIGERLMLPAKYVEELKSAPVEDVDFVGTFFEVSCGQIPKSKAKSV